MSKHLAYATLVLLIAMLCSRPVAADEAEGQPGVRAPAPQSPIVTQAVVPAGADSVYVPPSYPAAPIVQVPSSPFARPGQLYVLPVIVAPAGQGRWLPAPGQAGLNLDGDPFVGSPNNFSDTFPVMYSRAANNLSAHLHTARLMYEHMMRNPLNGEPRGTFALARWDAQAGVARTATSVSQRITPLVMELGHTTLQDIVDEASTTPSATAFWVEEILDRIGCQRMSCPFVLAIVVVGNPFNPEHGAKWNYGYNNGGGAAYLNYISAVNSWDTHPGADHDFLSTLVHELGHGFGLPHINDYCEGDGACPGEPRLDQSMSASIMGYSAGNKIFGCPRSSSRDPTHCDVPEPRDADHLPGLLEREDKRVLNANKLAFPGFEYQPALDHPAPTDPVYRLDAGGDWAISSVGRLYVESEHSAVNSVRPSVLIGGHSESFLEIEETDSLRTWVSANGDFGTWANYHVNFPANVTLERVRVYGGYDGAIDRPSGLQLFAAGDPTPLASAYNLNDANNDLLTLNSAARTGSHFVLQFQRGASGYARVRGLRFFGKWSGARTTRELYPPAEPVATTGYGSTFGGSIDNIVGSDQLLADASLPFQPQASWHSSARVPGTWVSVDVEMPSEVTLRGITVASGHTAGVHRARQVQIERECVCRYPYSGSGASCRMQSMTQCSAVGGTGSRVYEVVVWEPDPFVDDYVDFADITAKRWRIAMKTADGPSGSDSWMVLRGLRFWAPGPGIARELFPIRAHIP